MQVLIPADDIHKRVAALAGEVTAAFGGQPVTIVGVLTGSLIFLADLIRHFDFPVKIALISASSYRGETTTAGQLTINPDLLPDLTGRNVLLIDDILDTGQTITKIVAHIRSRGVAAVKVAVLLRKVGRQRVPFEPDFCGFQIPDAFVVGYGLDYNDEYRNLPFIGVLPGATH